MLARANGTPIKIMDIYSQPEWVSKTDELLAAQGYVLLKETSQLVELGPLTAVQTSHWIGRNPDGMVEDFQAIRLVYVGFCPDPTDPVVRDRGGTTNDARWVELNEWRGLPWTVGWWTILDQLLNGRRSVNPGG